MIVAAVAFLLWVGGNQSIQEGEGGVVAMAFRDVGTIVFIVAVIAALVVSSRNRRNSS